MQSKLLRKFGGLVATAAVTLFLIGCNGKAGQNGATGATGATGPAGPAGNNGTPANAINVGMLSTDDWSKLTIQGEIIGTPTVSATAGNPVVKFKLHDENGNPLIGMGKWTTQSATANVATMPNLYFTIAKLIPADPTSNAPSKWVNYLVTAIPTKATGQPALADPTHWNLSTPGTDAVQANLVDNNDGTYQYTFYRDITKTAAAYTNYTDAGNNHKADLGTAAELTFDPTAVHRLVVVAGGSARNTGNSATHDQNTATGADSGVLAVPTNTAANIYVDFRPSGAAVAATEVREVVTTASCNACHTKLGASFHNNTRVDTHFCVTCHTEQRKFGSADTAFSAAYTNPGGKIAGQAQGTFPTFIHRLHMGEELTATGYNYASLGFNEVAYPQGKACSTCHSGTAAGATVATASGDDWYKNPSRYTCGACHDDIDWSVAHQGAVRSDDSACKGCHVQASNPTYYDIRVAHTGNTVSIHNAAPRTGVASFSYEIGTITYDGSHNLVVPFKIKKDGAYVTHLQTAASVTNSTTGVKVLNPDARPMPDFPGFIGGPSFVVNYAQPQDGIAAPADYNISLSVGLPNLLVAAGSPSMGSVTLTADANNYFVATITGDLVGQTPSRLAGSILPIRNPRRRPLPPTRVRLPTGRS